MPCIYHQEYYTQNPKYCKNKISIGFIYLFTNSFVYQSFVFISLQSKDSSLDKKNCLLTSVISLKVILISFVTIQIFSIGKT